MSYFSYFSKESLKYFPIDKKLNGLTKKLYVDTLILCCICEANISASSKKYIDREWIFDYIFSGY